MKTIPINERPDKKIQSLGPKALSNAELLSLIIQNGCKERSAVEIADDTLSYLYEDADTNFMVHELTEVYGIGPKKACEVAAAIELGARLSSKTSDKPKFDDSATVAKRMMEAVRGDKREHFIAFYLNSKMRLERQYTVSIGNLNSAVVKPREVFSPAVKICAAGMVVAHNHPSGDPTHTSEDLEITKSLVEAGKLLGIPVIDHIVVGDGTFVSMRGEGLVEF